MNVFLPSRVALWASVTAISLPYACKAQNTTYSTDVNRCHSLGKFSSSAIVNSTGSQSFRWSSQEKDWYFTTTFNDTRDPILVGGLQDLEGYISAPADTEAEVCVYMMRGMNATGGREDGCEGVLSQSCVDWLTKNVTYAPWNDGRRERCANTPQREEFETTCGGDVGFYVSTGLPQNLSNHTCTILSPPGNSMPTDYLTHRSIGIGMSPMNSDQLIDNFAFYDLYVKQTRPWLITSSIHANSGFLRETKVICQAPDRVLEGSRQPESGWPPEQQGGGTFLAPWNGVSMPYVLIYLVSIALIVW